MKILLIGGTGVISRSISELLIACGHEVFLLNRAHAPLPQGAQSICCDIRDEDAVSRCLAGLRFDAIADFIAFTRADVERDVRLFGTHTGQYVFISSASAYQKPLSDYRITESTPLANPYWQYSRSKIEAEDYLVAQYRENGFPCTIVRPSHTYSERSIPLAVKGNAGPWSVLRRIAQEQPVLIHGDGSSLWTVTHSTDFARGFAGLLGNAHALGEAVQITSDESITWNQLYAILARILDKPLHAVHVSSDFLAAAGAQYDFYGGLLGDKANTVVFDNAKLKRLVPGFCATVRADEGLRQSVAYLQAHVELQREDPEFDVWTDRVIAAQQAALQALL
ncbi:MAG: NAD-dependent epimerase/dehydratase family protein [Pygmaiobacter sp.]